MLNLYTGETELAVAGSVLRLRFTWGALAALRSAWGEGFQERMLAAIEQTELGDLADMIAAASGLTADRVRELSPPIMQTKAALQSALSVAYYGPGGPPKAKEDGRPFVAAMARLRVQLTRAWAHIWRRVGT